MNISLFITCLTDTFYPDAGRAVVDVLRRCGCEVGFPAGQTCCGQPMFNNGYHREAADLARRMIDLFSDAAYIVTPSGSCCAMVREHYPQLLPGDARCESFVKRTYEFVEFLHKVLKIDLRAMGCRRECIATYHYSCHLRGLGMTDEAVQLLRQIDGLEYRPLERIDQCCGFGGTFAVKFPEISGPMVDDKIACIANTNADVLVCNDGGCAMNIAGALHRAGSNIRVMHIAELIAEGLKGNHEGHEDTKNTKGIRV
jgi:L-lactate dehydrogenase complex protein LldE